MPKYTENLAILSNGTPFALSTHWDGAVEKAFDGINDVYHSWVGSRDVLPNYLGFNFNKEQVIVKMTFKLDTPQMPSNMKIQASNDNSTWVDLYSDVNWDKTVGRSDQYKSVDILLNNTIAYKYYRVYFISANDPYPHIGEWEMYGGITTKYLIQDKSNILYILDSTPLLNILDGTLTKDLFKNKGFSDPTVIKSTNISSKSFSALDKGVLGIGRYFEFSLKDDMKTIKSIE